MCIPSGLHRAQSRFKRNKPLEQPLQDERYYADDDGCYDRPSKGSNLKPGHQGAGNPDHDTIQDKEKKTQCQYGYRQREKKENRLYQSIQNS